MYTLVRDSSIVQMGMCTIGSPDIRVKCTTGLLMPIFNSAAYNNIVILRQFLSYLNGAPVALSVRLTSHEWYI